MVVSSGDALAEAESLGTMSQRSEVVASARDRLGESEALLERGSLLFSRWLSVSIVVLVQESLERAHDLFGLLECFFLAARV